MYRNFCTLITYFPNKLLLFLCTVLTIFLQIVFVDQIMPYNSDFNTKKSYHTLHIPSMANLLFQLVIQ